MSSNVVKKKIFADETKKEKKKNESPSEYDFIGFDCARVLHVKVVLAAILKFQGAFY